MSDSVEISSSQYMDDIVDWLCETKDCALPAERIYELVESKYRDHFSKADKRMHKLPNGKSRPKWMNSVDWAKAQGARQKLLATVRFKNRNWVVLLNSTSDEWKERAAKKKKRRCFKKRCRECRRWNSLSNLECKCGYKFPPKAARRVVEELR